MNEVGLVLEGGGMRGLYTAGVLEYFLENDLFFPYVIGVSAGACMGASYLSRQAGRNKKVNTDLVNDHRYLSIRNLILKKQLFGMDFLFDEIPNKIVPFDFETFLVGTEQFVIGTTNCETGEAVYYNKHDHGKDILKIIRASSSLPFLAPPVNYDNKMLLDGGIIDPIPIKKSQSAGYIRNVVIMTKAEDYKKNPGKLTFLSRLLYRHYPKIASLLQKRYITYNEILTYMEEQKQKGNLYIIQPSIELPVSRIEKNQTKLLNLYELGYNDAKYQFKELNKWINY